MIIVASCAVVSELDEDVAVRDWTIFRGSSSLCGNVDCKLPDMPQLLWSKSVQTRTVASPIVYDGIVYTLDRKGRLRAFTENGDSTLVHDFQTSVEASFIAHDSVLYIGRIDSYVNAYSIPKNRIIWKYETMGQISGSPNIVKVGERMQLLIGSYDSNMYCFDAATGKKTSQFETGYYINGTAAVWKRYMVFGGCDAWLRIVDTTTGNLTDSLQLDAYLPASPAILGDVAYEADYSGNIYEIHIEAGRFVSHKKLVKSDTDNENESGGLVSMPTATHDAVIAFSGERNVCCYERSTGKLRWKKMLRGFTGESSPLVAKDKVLVCTKDGHVSIFDINDGSELWHYEAGEQIISSPAIVGGRFYVLTARGTLICFG